MQFTAFLAVLMVLVLANVGVAYKTPPPICNNAGDWGEVNQASAAARNLAGRPGRAGVGPRRCVRIECVGVTEVLLCNDNSYYIEPNIAYLATYVNDIIGRCANVGIGLGPIRIKGQEFDTDGYNVVVRRGQC